MSPGILWVLVGLGLFGVKFIKIGFRVPGLKGPSMKRLQTLTLNGEP